MAEPEPDGTSRTQVRRGSDFDAGDLRLISGLYADPLTRAIRNEVLRFRSPVRPDDARRALLRIGEILSDPVAVAIGRGALRFAETLDRSRGLVAVGTAFALNRRLHLFRAEPSVDWAQFTEPQLTKGLARFLNAPDPATRIERVRALLSALGAAGISNDMSEAAVTAEAPIAGGKRIDLLIEWKDSSERRYAAAIEAKLGHHVTKGQLPAYRAHLRKIAKGRPLLVVVSPRRSEPDDRSLRRNPDWRWMSWHDLLVAHERCLPDNCDDDAYARFRRTLWDQTG